MNAAIPVRTERRGVAPFCYGLTWASSKTMAPLIRRDRNQDVSTDLLRTDVKQLLGVDNE